MSVLTFDPDRHIYSVDGKRLPSVTDIIKPLMIFGDVGIQIIQQAARRGTAVHEYAELIDYGIDPDDLEVEPELAGYVTAYTRFLRDYKPEWELIEKPLYSLELGYAGTLDRFGIIDGEKAIVDIKTSSSAVRSTRIAWAVQLEAYLNLLGCGFAKRYDLWLKNNGTYQLISATKTEEKYGFKARDLFAMLLEIKKITGGKK
jgi:hypothetical protein